MVFINYLINSIINSYTSLYLSHKLIVNKNKFITKRLLIIGFLYAIYLSGIYMFSDNIVRIILNYILLCLINLYLYRNEKKAKVILTTFYTWLMLLAAEIVFALIFIMGLQMSADIYQTTFFGSLFGNFMICLISIILINIKQIRNYLKSEISKKEAGTFTAIFIMFTLLIIAISIIFTTSFNQYNDSVILILNIILIGLYLAATSYIMFERQKGMRLEIEYQTLIDTLQEYEDMLDYQRKSNHENKNQLLSIKGLVSSKNKELNDYLDIIIKEKHEDDQLLINKTKKIPAGGLRGLIYSKVLLMKKNNINFEINTSKNLSQYDATKMSLIANQQLCKIVGVFTDNAIEAVSGLSIKNIVIGMSIEENIFNISISNNYTGMLEITKMGNKFSTKGKKRGYGLVLVKDIVSNNNIFINEKYINGNVFTQVVKVKM